MTSVLIAGAGPTGLTLACDLARWGVDVRVVDKSPEFPRGSRGKTLNPRSLEILADLGVIDEVTDAGSTHLRYRKYRDAQQISELDPFAEPGPTPDAPYDSLVFIPQWRTEEILRDKLATFGVKVELGMELTGFTQTPDAVRATMADGSVITADYLVGCDGGHSLVRKLLGVSFDGETAREQTMICGDVEVDGLDPDVWHQWIDDDGAVLLSPFRCTKSWQLQASCERDANGRLPEPSLATFQRLFDRHARIPGVRLRELTWSTTWTVNTRMVDRYRVGRVFLAGDAAHIHPIAGGLGMNTGIQDAWNLGWKLALVLTGQAGPNLLDTYEEERLPIAAWTLNLTTDRLNVVMAAVRKAGVGLERALTPEGRGLTIGYPWSSLAGTGGGGRAPDAPTTGGRLFDMFAGPHFTLLTFGTAQPEIPTDIVRTWRITDDPARRTYGITGDAMVLIRPDNYIALTSTDPQAVTDYLTALGG